MDNLELVEDPPTSKNYKKTRFFPYLLLYLNQNLKNVQQFKMVASYDQILDDLLETTPENVTMVLPTIDMTQTPEMQVLHRY